MPANRSPIGPVSHPAEPVPGSALRGLQSCSSPPVRIDADPPLCNDREQAQVDTALLEQAIQKAIVLGDTVLRELMRPQEAAPAEWDYLRGFRTRDAHSRRRPTRPSTRPCAGACWWSRSTASGGCACR